MPKVARMEIGRTHKRRRDSVNFDPLKSFPHIHGHLEWESSMNKLLLSLCLLGAALAMGNSFLSQKSACPAAWFSKAVSAPQANAPQPQAATGKAKRRQAQKPAGAQSPAPQHDVQLTGSLGGARQRTNGAALASAQIAKSEAKPSHIADGSAEWAEVSVATNMHRAPSFSAPIVQHYGVGTQLRVISRKSGWINIVHPVTSKRGWIQEKYLTTKLGPAQTAERQPPPPGMQKLHKQRRWHRAYRPKLRIVFGVYPGW
jgi:hypothetical protein